MLMSLLVTLTLVAQAQPDANDANERGVQSFAERLKASHELKKPAPLEADEEDNNDSKNSHAARPFQVRMTQTVAGRR